MKPKVFSVIFSSSIPALICLFTLICGCDQMMVKHVNPNEPNTLERNEKVVFGRINFMAHSEEVGSVSFLPFGLGLVHVEARRRAQGSELYEKALTSEPLSERSLARKVSTRKPWFEDDGTFFWVLPTGNYQIDALGWALGSKVTIEDLMQPKAEQFFFPLKPENPPECGFVVSPNMAFAVSGDSGALYIGSLLVDMDISMKQGVEVLNINSIEVKDEYAEAAELIKSRYPSFALTVEKRLMSSIPDRPASFTNHRCPTWAEIFLRVVVGIAIQLGPAFIPVGLGVGPSIILPPLGIGR